MRMHCAGLIVAGLLYAGTACSATVAMDAGQLTVQAVNTALREVLAAISKQANIEMEMMGDVNLGETLVSVDFNDIPLEQGLARLLSGWNYALVTDETSGELRKIFILSARDVVASEPPAGDPSGLDPGTQLNSPASSAFPGETGVIQDSASLQPLAAQLASQDPPTQITALRVMREQPVTDPALLAEVRRLVNESTLEVQEEALNIMMLNDPSEEAKQVLKNLAEQPDGQHRDVVTQHLTRMEDEARAAVNGLSQETTAPREFVSQ